MSGRRLPATLLQNDDEAEVKHLTRLLKNPPPWAGKEIRVVTWSGGWLCVCGRVCWAKQHCKAPRCGHNSPCRNWCFEGGCNMPSCRYPHPKFYLPVDRPAVGPDGKAADGRELIRLPLPGTLPACMRKQLAAQAQPSRPSQPPASAPATPAHNAAISASASNGGVATGGELWLDLEARARAAMPAAGGSATGSLSSTRSTTPVPDSASLFAAEPAALAPPAGTPAPLLPPAAQPHAPAGSASDEAEVEAYLAMLGIA